MSVEGKSTKSRRKSIRLPHYDYSHVGWYFVTLCTRGMKEYFGKCEDGKMRLNVLGAIIDEYWSKIPNRFLETTIDEYVVMPNHMHGIIVINKSTPVGAIHELPLRGYNKDEYRIMRRKMLLPKIIGWFKMNTSKQMSIRMNRIRHPFWQRNYYEHIIRNDRELEKIREYIFMNPNNWHLDKYFS